MTPLYLQAVSARLTARCALALHEENPTADTEKMLRDAVRNADAKDRLLSLIDPDAWSLYIAWVTA